ncbi:MAG: hypothetical protein VKN56_06520 [Cyanobacteriota bacterium]|nr:hypothetical protein [Cyanobacteriota bacterium]
MDWVDDEGGAPPDRPGARESWREPRTEFRPNKRGLEERLEGWMTRGRELVDGVSGTRPGTRPGGRGAERSGGSQGGLDGLGRWVEGRLDWLLDDRDDWREPWQEADRPSLQRSEAPPPSPRRSRVPLEAISRRGIPGSASGTSWRPPRSEQAGVESPPATAPAPKAPSPDSWPEEETFSVPRWRREEPPPPPAANPLADPAPAVAPGRPLPRSTRRQRGGSA